VLSIPGTIRGYRGVNSAEFSQTWLAISVDERYQMTPKSLKDIKDRDVGLRVDRSNVV
jgi:hypothetical protein